MSVAIPKTRPRLTKADVQRRIARAGIDRARHPLVILGIRGYYANTLGVPGKNDRGIYDDAIFIDAPEASASFNANTDPSRVRKGSGVGAAKGMASLKAGVWPVYRFDKHKGQYLALCQRGGNVTVIRDGEPPYPDTGLFGINIHRGGVNTTSSEGCQTIPPAQWDAFIAMAVDQAKRLFGDRWAQTSIPYVLLEEA